MRSPSVSAAYIGGWRVIRTLGKGLVEIESFRAGGRGISAAIILSSSAAGMALSTTTWPPARSWAAVWASRARRCVGLLPGGWRWRGWSPCRRPVWWVVSCFWVGHGIGAVTAPLVGSIVIFSILVALSFYMWWRAQQQKVDHTNVNAVGTPPPTRWYRRIPATPAAKPKTPSGRGRPEEIPQCIFRKHRPSLAIGAKIVGRRATTPCSRSVAAVFRRRRGHQGPNGTACQANPVLRALKVR